MKKPLKESKNEKDQTNPDQQNPSRSKAEKIHPTLWIQGHRSSSLAGKTIVLGVTGSIGAVRVVELSRELIRNGAEVHAVMTEAAKHILHPDALHYATGNPIITELGGS